jgi:hypothetical protein
MPPPPDPLDSLLDRWHQSPEPEPYLTREVWRRIAADDRRAEHLGFFARMEAVFRQPAFSVAFVSACVLLGLFLAEVRLAHLHAQQGAQIAQSYLKLIDPLIEQQPAVKVAARNP